jgi:lysophospholipase L1-like esterase
MWCFPSGGGLKPPLLVFASTPAPSAVRHDLFLPHHAHASHNRITMKHHLLLAVLLATSLHAAPVLKPGARVAVVGDSITEQKQYSRFIEMYLTVCVPQFQARCFQFGWGGETAGGFLRRMDNDLATFKPDVVTTCYGMNDGGYRAFTADIGKNYENPMRQIVTKLKTAGVTVVVGGPGVVDTKYFNRATTPADVYNDNLAHLSAIARKLADENTFPFANVHDAMIAAMTKGKAALGPDYDVGGRDGVHPAANGHLVMAYAFLKGMGLDGDIGTITVDLKGQATGTDGHKVLSAAAGKVELESSRYPFCFTGDDKSSGGTRSILPFCPFNQDLNRLTLVVKNLTGARAKVTWEVARASRPLAGTHGQDAQATKSFTRDQLATGINLAAEFPQTPFNTTFAAVERAISAKEDFETFLIKDMITKFPTLLARTDNDPEMKDALEVMRRKLLARHDKLARAVADAVQPVKHTLVIQAE